MFCYILNKDIFNCVLTGVCIYSFFKKLKFYECFDKRLDLVGLFCGLSKLVTAQFVLQLMLTGAAEAEAAMT